MAERLPYLADLGVNAIYLTPIFQSASNHRYHTFDHFHVDPLLGGEAALRELLDRAHERGMRVVLDGVFNHTGRGLWPFHHILETGASSPYRDWFHLDREVLEGHRLITPYPPHDAMTGASLGYQTWWGLPALPKLNTDHPPVREYLLEVAEYWLRFGIDGWRLDVPAEIDDERSGRRSAGAAARSATMRALSGRSGRSRRTGCAAIGSMRSWTTRWPRRSLGSSAARVSTWASSWPITNTRRASPASVRALLPGTPCRWLRAARRPRGPRAADRAGDRRGVGRLGSGGERSAGDPLRAAPPAASGLNAGGQ